MKIILFIVIAGFSINCCYGGDYEEKAFTADEIYWLGIDYSNVRCIGKHGFNKPGTLNYYFSEWNKLVINEIDKFNIPKFFRVDDVSFLQEVVVEGNKNVDPGKIVIEKDYSFGKEKVEQIVSGLSIDEDSGVGLIFIAETLNKNHETGTYWITYVDVATNKVLYTIRIRGDTGGIGFRNYWGNSIYNAMKNIRKDIKQKQRNFK